MSSHGTSFKNIVAAARKAFKSKSPDTPKKEQAPLQKTANPPAPNQKTTDTYVGNQPANRTYGYYPTADDYLVHYYGRYGYRPNNSRNDSSDKPPVSDTRLRIPGLDSTPLIQPSPLIQWPKNEYNRCVKPDPLLESLRESSNEPLFGPPAPTDAYSNGQSSGRPSNVTVPQQNDSWFLPGNNPMSDLSTVGSAADRELDARAKAEENKTKTPKTGGKTNAHGLLALGALGKMATPLGVAISACQIVDAYENRGRDAGNREVAKQAGGWAGAAGGVAAGAAIGSVVPVAGTLVGGAIGGIVGGIGGTWVGGKVYDFFS